MTRFLIRIGISIVIGWMIGVQAAFAFGPEGKARRRLRRSPKLSPLSTAPAMV